MNCAAHRRDFGARSIAQSRSVYAPGILQRISDWLSEMRAKKLNRQITHVLGGRSGDHLTDSLEREITQRLLTSDWSVNRSELEPRLPLRQR